MADGTTDFSVLQNELNERSTKIALVALDLLYLNGYDLRKLPLFEHKGNLRELVAGTDIQFSESFEINGREMFKQACKTAWKASCRRCGTAAARPDGPTTGCCVQRETLTIAGFALDGDDWDGLYVGRRKGGDLVYAGKVNHGSDADSAKMLRAKLTPFIRKTQPYTKRIAHRGI
jgi:bifunctional non-homologous end joining protein LigD